MKYIVFLCLVVLVACATKPHSVEISISDEEMAYASIADGNVQASGTKTIQNKNVCFDITIISKETKLENVLPSNWVAAWVDSKSRYHLLNMNQRHPASVPVGRSVSSLMNDYEEWTSHLKTCIPESRAHQVQKIVLVPKELPFETHEWLELNWN